MYYRLFEKRLPVNKIEEELKNLLLENIHIESSFQNEQFDKFFNNLLFYMNSLKRFPYVFYRAGKIKLIKNMASSEIIDGNELLVMIILLLNKLREYSCDDNIYIIFNLIPKKNVDKIKAHIHKRLSEKDIATIKKLECFILEKVEVYLIVLTSNFYAR